MRKTLLLLAGSPGTGKTYLDNLIRKEIPGFKESSIDVFKEKLYDNYGFDDLKERTQLDNKAYELFYKEVAKLMEETKSIISDYPFSFRQRDTLKRLADRYEFQIITITLVADFDILYQRRLKRGKDSQRHLGHVMTHYHKGDCLEDRNKIEIKANKNEMKKFNEQRGYDKFKLGKTFVVDVTDFSKVDYGEIISQIKALVIP